MNSSRHAAILLFASGVAACAPRPRLVVAPTVTAQAWRESNGAGETSLADAWSAFGSPELAALVARARGANADIAVARARVIQARGQLAAARASRLPEVSGVGGLGVSGRDRRGVLDDTSLGLDISYDIDLFGGNRASRRAASARATASAFDARGVALAVEAEVARAYIRYAAASTRIALLTEALGNARELDRIIGVQVREGAATRVASGLQRIEVRRIEAEISRIDEARARTKNALAILVGAEAPSFTLAPATLRDLRAPAFEAVQPGTLLVRRPDLRAAEARIAAANGDVARARAAFLPGLRISAGSFVDGGGPLGLALSAGSSLLAPIFAGGRLRGDLQTASGAQLESVERYRGTLLTALGEAEDALTGIDRSGARSALFAETLTVARTTARLARRQYVEGAADLQTVLDAERGALDIEDASALAVQDRLEAAVDLYRALGGAPDFRSIQGARP